MADQNAIYGVSRTLKTLLESRMDRSDFAVTLAPPDVAPDLAVDSSDAHRINLYLYQVTENGFLKNQEIPGQGHPGAYGQPPLSLDLHYLMTVFPNNETTEDADLVSQQLLGEAMRLFHDFSIVTANLFETAGDDTSPRILDASLQGESECIKLTLEPMDMEGLSKIWSVLPQAGFRRSVAYQVSVVQIESERARSYPQPVREPPDAGPRVKAVSFRRPRIQSIRVIRQGDPDERERNVPYARIGDRLVLRGNNLASENTRVLLGEVEVEEVEVERERHVPSGSGQITIPIPNKDELQAGPQPIRLTRDVSMEEGGESRVGFRSNVCVFVLVPHVSEINRPDAAPQRLEISGTGLFYQNLECLTLIGDNVIGSDQYLVRVLFGMADDTSQLEDSLNAGEVPEGLREKLNSEGFHLADEPTVTSQDAEGWLIDSDGLRFIARKEGDTLNITLIPSPARIEIHLPDSLASGDHPVRVRVNGAESFDEATVTVP